MSILVSGRKVWLVVVIGVRNHFGYRMQHELRIRLPQRFFNKYLSNPSSEELIDCA